MYIISASEVRVTKAPLWFSISLKRFPATKVLKVSSSWTEGVAMEPMQQSPNWPLGKKSYLSQFNLIHLKTWTMQWQLKRNCNVMICDPFHKTSWCTMLRSAVVINANIARVASQHLSSLLAEHLVRIPLHNSEPLQLQCKRRKRCNLRVRTWWVLQLTPDPGQKVQP